MAGVAGASGGKRKGAGRPKKTKDYSEETKNGWLKAIKKVAKEKGQTYQEVLVEMLYDNDIQDTVKASIAKIIGEVLVVKATEQKIDVKADKGPVFYIPKKDPDPAGDD